MSANRTMKLGLFLRGEGHHEAGWRHPAARNGGMDFGYYRDMAEIAERGLLDFLFFADHYAVPNRGQELPYSPNVVRFDPITLVAALAGVTQHIGMVATASTTYMPPWLLARQFASLDHLTGGRVGWNIVTSIHPNEAANFGSEGLPEHATRYRRAAEYVEVVKGLWDSWDDDAFLLDKERGLYFDPDKAYALNHHGEFYDVAGPLNVARPVSGYPVLVQAGSSDAGRDLAASVGELVFTAQNELGAAQAFYRDLKDRAVAAGRDPSHVAILPGIFPIVAGSRSEADELFEEIQDLLGVELGLAQLGALMGNVDLSSFDLDQPLPDLARSGNAGSLSRYQLLMGKAREHGWTLRQMYRNLAGTRGHFLVRGTAQDVADTLEEWFSGAAADGFNVLPPLMPDTLVSFVEQVIPELQRRGLFKTAYGSSRLRDNLGLPRPENQLAAAKRAGGAQ